jgi:hypothetical protein
VTTRFHHYYTPYQNIIYDDLLNLFCDVNYIFIIILSPISSSHATYDENGHFVIEYVPFCDQSLQRHEQIITDKHFSSSGCSPPQPRTFSESYAHQASSEPSHTRFCFSFPQHHSGEVSTDSKTGVQDPSHGKRFQNESF